jgi:hypothetical protein
MVAVGPLTTHGRWAKVSLKSKVERRQDCDRER